MLRISHNESVTTSPATYSQALRSVKRPDPVAVGTIVWLGSEVMFFAGLFAIYFTLRNASPELTPGAADPLIDAERNRLKWLITCGAVVSRICTTCSSGISASRPISPM